MAVYGKIKLAVYYEFAKWYAMPTFVLKEMELPLTQKAFAELYNVSEKTLSTWVDDVDFADDVARARTKWARRMTSDMVMGLYRKGTTGEGGDVAAFSKWMEEFEGRKPEEKSPVNAVKRISAEAFLDEEGNLISSSQTAETLNDGKSNIG